MRRDVRKLATWASKINQTSLKVKDAGTESSKNGAPAMVNNKGKLASPTKAKGKQHKRMQINVTNQDNNVSEIDTETPVKKAKIKLQNNYQQKLRPDLAKKNRKLRLCHPQNLRKIIILFQWKLVDCLIIFPVILKKEKWMNSDLKIHLSGSSCKLHRLQSISDQVVI